MPARRPWEGKQVKGREAGNFQIIIVIIIITAAPSDVDGHYDFSGTGAKKNIAPTAKQTQQLILH